jgi:hypothetical protein
MIVGIRRRCGLSLRLFAHRGPSARLGLANKVSSAIGPAQGKALSNYLGDLA